MNPLDVPFEELAFRLPCNGRVYTVAIERFVTLPLHDGLLEQAYMDPEEWADELKELRDDEIGRIETLKGRLEALWGRRQWTVLTPPPHHADAAFQSPERLFGRLCAAVLQSTDDFFPRPYRGAGGDSPADYSEACVIYAVGQSEGLFPERLRNQIAWEDVARARIV